jgi:hypothetical protein
MKKTKNGEKDRQREKNELNNNIIKLSTHKSSAM